MQINSGAFAYFILGAGCYLYGEYNYYHDKLKFKDVLDYAVKLSKDAQYDAINNGKLLYLIGTVFGTRSLQDRRSTFKFSLPSDSVALVRNVAIYQKKHTGRFTSTTTWFDSIIDYEMIRPPFKNRSLRSTWFISPSYVGPFRISKKLIQQIPVSLPIPGGLPEEIGLQIHPPRPSKKKVDPKDTVSVWFKQQPDGWYYYVDNQGTPGNPEIGDVRMRYRYVPGNTQVSILAKQDGKHLKAFTSSIGTEIEQLHLGHLSLDEFVDESVDPDLYWNLTKLGGIAIASVGIILANTNKEAAGGFGGALFGAWFAPRVWHWAWFGKVLVPGFGIGSETVYPMQKSSATEGSSTSLGQQPLNNKKES